MAQFSRLSGGQRTALSATGVAGLCALASLLVLLVLPSQSEGVLSLQRRIAALFAPVIEIVSWPGEALDGLTNYFQTMADLRAENAVLKSEIDELSKRVQTIAQIRFENEQLRNLLSMNLSNELIFQGAEVLADLKSPFSKTVLIGAGADDGIEMGQAVLGAQGFYGRIIAVGTQTSRVLRLTDFNSHIPVVIGAGDVRAILTGTSSNDPILEYVPPEAKLQPGDIVQTSGDGGKIPPGLMVGTVLSSGDGDFFVRLAQEGNAVDFVRVLRKALPTAPEMDVGAVGTAARPASEQPLAAEGAE